MGDVRLTPYRPDHREQLVALLGAPQARSALWRWQFESNPRGVPFDPVLVEDGTGRVAGFNGVMPVRVRHDGIDRLACWSCDFHVHPDHRGTGVGRLVKEVLHARHPLLLTFGVSDVAFGVLRHLGWQQNPDVHHYRLLRRFAGWKDAVRQVLQYGNRLRRYRYSGGRTAAGNSAVEALSRLPAASEVDALWDTVAPGYPRIVCRDHVYLGWRYEACPVGDYRYLALRDGGRLRALAVYRCHGDVSRLVDMVAAAGDEHARERLLVEWLRLTDNARQFHVVTSDPSLGRALTAAGFLRSRNQPRFLVRGGEGIGPDPAAGWFIMAGDSDGEFLQAAREAIPDETSAPSSVTGGKGTDVLRVCRLDAGKLFAEREVWDELLSRSDANPLFMGWAWQSAWWETWHALLGLEPCLVGVYRGDRLVGLAPLYAYRRRRLGMGSVELQFVGNAWKIRSTVRTEYTGILARRGQQAAVRGALEDYLRLHVPWDQLVVCDHVGGELFPGLANDRRIARLSRKTDTGWVIDCRDSFSAWLERLGKNTRLKVFNRRKYLAGRATLRYRREPDVDAALRDLNAFHRRRWGKPCFEGPSFTFHRRFLERCGDDAEVRFSVLEIDGVVRSVLYDLRVGDRVYNLQAGFDEQYDPKVSLGTLHLGYAIEEAFSDPRISAYDMLAGVGKTEDYKRRFLGRPVDFETYQLIRGPLLRAAYGFHQRTPAAVRRPLRRWLGKGGGW